MRLYVVKGQISEKKKNMFNILICFDFVSNVSHEEISVMLILNYLVCQVEGNKLTLHQRTVKVIDCLSSIYL